MKAETLLREGKLDEAVDALVAYLRDNPEDAKGRTFLFELLCFRGEYDRARKHLALLAQGKKDNAIGALLYEGALQAEELRQKMFETGEYPGFFPPPGMRMGRSPRDGYSRGWGLEYGGLRDAVLADPLYSEALELAMGRSIQAGDCRMNLFLLLKYFFPALLKQSGKGSIVEFGSYRGGSSIFLAAVCERLHLDVRVFGLDTFTGMPPTDKSIDAHFAGNFSDVDLPELRAHVERCGLAHRLEFVPGIFQDTAPRVLAAATPVLAFPNGAAPEIIDHGRTGYLCRDEDEMSAASAHIGEIDRLQCRAAAEQRFSLARMAADYERLYRAILETRGRVTTGRTGTGAL